MHGSINPPTFTQTSPTTCADWQRDVQKKNPAAKFVERKGGKFGLPAERLISNISFKAAARAASMLIQIKVWRGATTNVVGGFHDGLGSQCRVSERLRIDGVYKASTPLAKGLPSPERSRHRDRD